MLAIRIPVSVERRLDKLAKKTGRSKTFYAREAILEHLGDLEDYYLALRRIEEGLRTIPLKEVEKRVLATGGMFMAATSRSALSL